MLFASAAPFTRPADVTAYASGDLVANSTTAADVVPLDFNQGDFWNLRSGWIRRANLRIVAPAVGIANGTFNLDLFRRRPRVNAGDNAALAVRQGPNGEPRWICRLTGSLVLTTSVEAVGQLTPGSATNPFDVPIKLERANAPGEIDDGLFGLLSAGGAWTPVALAQFHVSLDFDTPSV